ncbi:MAG: HIT domain-containing protein [Anaerolineales bacterium]|nr:HIT domain-containing protein [Anaerolineales bacterium]
MSEPSCIFCRIIAGEADASLVYQDDQVIAFMDIQPITPGHLLIVPKRHAAHLAELDDETGGRMFAVARRLARALRASRLRCEGINLFLADGVAAGQTVFHSHLHVIARYPGDGFGFRFPPGYSRGSTREALEQNAEEIRAALESQEGNP